MKIGLAQYDISWENKRDNMAVCEGFFKEAQAAGVDLLVFPELSLTGFTMDLSLAEPADGLTSSFFSRLAEQYGIAAVFGYAERNEGGFFNRLAFADEQGRISARYTKLHPFSAGGEVYSGGDELCVFRHCGMTVGLTVCYDLRFPEIYCELSKHCSLIINAANWGGSRREHWLSLLMARAVENQCFIAGVNRIGEGGGVSYTGDSAVFSPCGERSAFGGDRQGLVCCEISVEEVNPLRESFPVKRDRRPELYRNFYE